MTTERELMVNGVRLHLMESGSGSLVVMLHGFPEFSYEWRRQIPAVSAAGFHVVAPDQRGYARSDKPRRRRDYRVETLAADVVGLMDACGAHRASLVGHDWGGIVAYYTAMLQPERVDKLVILNAPHPGHFDRVLRRSIRQLRRSWYGVFFMLPWAPEATLLARRSYALRRTLGRDAAPGAFTQEDLEKYVAAWSTPGAMKATINWYRALAFRRQSKLRALWRRVDVPTLILWGDRDRHLLPEFAEPGDEWVSEATVVRFPEAGHWLPHDEPVAVNDRIIEFLAGSR